MTEFFANTANWVAISFVIFAFVAYKAGRASVLNSLDEKIEKIKRDLHTAENLRVEAQELLAQYQRKQREANSEAKRILDTAKKHTAQIQAQAEEQLEEAAMRRESWLAARLERMEADAIKEIKAQASELAIAATTEILSTRIDQDINARLIDQTLEELPQKLQGALN
ncbi:MAG: hypothetical protein AB7E85_08755 [Pseudobdellovibrionaceae bacterium]